MTEARVSESGISFCGLLGIVFITLKLTHLIEWSWIWVLSPLWIPIMSFLIVVIAFLALLVWLGHDDQRGLRKTFEKRGNYYEEE